MWEDKFDVKRYKSMRYVDCFCDKHASVLVGLKGYPYVNAVGSVCIIAFLLFLVQPFTPLFVKAIAVIALGLLIVFVRSVYYDGKKMMTRAGHTDFCGQKIGRLITLYVGPYSPYTIMKDDKENK